MSHPMTTFLVAVGFASTVGYLLMLRAQNRRAQDLLMSRLQGGRDRHISKRDGSIGDGGDYSSGGDGWSFSNWFGHSDSSGSASDSCGSSDSGDSGSSGDCGGGGGGGD
jgi:hypothetical protein